MRLAEQNRQADYFAQVGRQLAPHAQQIQGYLQQGRQQAVPIDPNKVPDFDPRWAALVDRDPSTGILVGKPGVPPEIVSKVNAYADWKQKFDSNPTEFINQAAEARAREIATTTFKEQFAQHNQAMTINNIIKQNEAWMYQVDPNTGVQARDYNNRPMYTPVATRYMHHLAYARNIGVTDPTHQDAYAKQAVRGEYALAAQKAAYAQSQQAASPATQQQQFRPNMNPSAAAPPLQRRGNPAVHNEPSEVGMSLRDRLSAALKAEGVTDQDVMSGFES